MARIHRLSTTGALIVCLVGSQLSGTLFASEEHPSSSAAPASSAEPSSQPVVDSPSAGQTSRFTLHNEIFSANAPLGEASPQLWRSVTFVPAESSSLAQWGRGRGRGGRHGAAQAEVVLGAIATIAGAAVLLYANRPECNSNHMASACGYGTKVVGGAVLSVGIVALLIGALTWR